MKRMFLLSSVVIITMVTAVNFCKIWNKWFVFFSICLLLQSCRFGKAVEEHRITDTGQSGLLRWVGSPFATVDLEHAPEYAYRDLIDTIRYIPLGDEYGVIGEIKNIISYKGRFYIQEDRLDRIFIYDESGRCLKKIDDKGRGPGEYLRVESIDIDKERGELLLVDGMSDKILHYDLDGGFKYIQHIGAIQTENTLWMRDSTFLHLMAPFQNNNNDMKGYALLLSKGTKNLYKGFRYIPLQVGYRGGGEIFKGDDRICYHPLYSDTIYQILSDSTYGPIYHFKLKNSSWEKLQVSDKFIEIDGNEEGIFSLLFENRDFFLGYIADKKRYGHMLTFLYDKVKDKSFLLKWNDNYRFLNELDYFEGYEVRGMYNDCFIAKATYSSFERNNIFDRVRNGSLKVTDPALEKIIRNYDTDSNPVLVLTKFKHL